MDSTNSLHHTFLGTYGAKQAPAHDEESRIAAEGRGEDNVASLHGHVHSPDFRIDPFCSSPGLRGGARPMTLVPGNDFSKIVVKVDHTLRRRSLIRQEAGPPQVGFNLGSNNPPPTTTLGSGFRGWVEPRGSNPGSRVGFNLHRGAGVRVEPKPKPSRAFQARGRVRVEHKPKPSRIRVWD